MDMKGENRIEAPRERVWQALNDPDVLKASIAGCEELDRTADNEFTAKVRAKVGPVSARFSGKVTLTDLDPPRGYRIQGEGTGGAAGFAKGGAVVSLEEDGAGTVLRYDVQATVGGKLAQIGSRLIDGTARKMADDFFARFKQQVESGGSEGSSGPGSSPEAGAPASSGSGPSQGGGATEPTAQGQPVRSDPEQRTPTAGATAHAPSAPSDLPTAPEVTKAFSPDETPAPTAPRSGPEMARADTPSRSTVRPELDATPGADPTTGPTVALAEVPRDMRPTSDAEPPPGEGVRSAHEDGDVSTGPGGYRAGMARMVGSNALVWGVGILAVIVVLAFAFG